MLLIATLLFSASAIDVPNVLLKNAAEPNLEMPMIGLGTFGYGSKPDGSTGEYWNNSLGYSAALEWIKLGGRRIDSAFSYKTQQGVGQAVIDSGVAREKLFILSKIPAASYNETMANFQTVLSNLQTTYVDNLLIHWPGPCQAPHLSPAECRQEAWKAISDIFDRNQTRAIGVSNFESNHIEDLLQLKGYVPSMNQVETHAYWHERDLEQWCHARDIHVQSYAPLGAPDYMAYKGTWSVLIPEQPKVAEIAQAHNRTIGQVLCRWATQQGISINPRTYKAKHMLENLNHFDFDLTQDDLAAIDALPNAPAPGTNKVCPDPHNIP